ncbi:PTS glucose transporter subunit IIA [Faecalibacterium prausnitzii]|uniref:PTS sugar transporter subunit IIA n=1 Tax=Faecalibacterium TaxID=216851 RepID=UPI0032AFBD74
MGFFDKLFGGKAEQEETAKFFGQRKTVLTPIRGKVLAQADIPDETFAQGILGPGCGIEPTGKTVYAPFDGTVEQVASTLHAVGLTSEDGIEILIHVGMDTVEMQGKGFKALVKVGDKVKAGTPLLKVDLDAIRAAGHPTATAIIVTNGDDLGELKMLAEGDVLAGTPLFKF